MNRKNIETNPLLETYKEYIEKIDNALNDELELYLESEFTEPLKYAIDGGKRIRPIILLLAAECVGKVDENTLSAACAIEFLHTESLILNISSRLDNPRITKDLATAAMLMSEGEAIEGLLEESEDVTFDDYVKVIEYKTATAFEMAAKLGAIIGKGAEEEIQALAEYGKNIGIAYQIRDDLLDWKNEDKLFNLLIKKSSDPRDVFNKMDEMLKTFSHLAESSLRKIKEGSAKNNLENLIKFTEFKA